MEESRNEKLELIPAVAEKRASSSLFIDFAMGSVTAAVPKTVTAPIERIKLLLQCQGELIKQGRLSEPYKGIADCFKRVVADEGAVSLWRGNFANVLRYFPYFPTNALSFVFHYQFKQLVNKERDGYALAFLGNLAAGGLAGASSLLFVYSLDYARTRLANDIRASNGGERRFRGITDVYSKTYATEGIAGLYRGFNAAWIGIIVYRGFYFGLYDSLKPILLKGDLKKSFLATFLLSWGVTITAGLASYPIDTVRRRMMMTSGEAVKYRSTIHAFSEIVKKEGTVSLFNGAGANILRSIAAAGALTAYDRLQQLLFGRVWSGSSG